MTKLERAAALLPLVIKAQKKKRSINLDILSEGIQITHFTNVDTPLVCGEIIFNITIWDFDTENMKADFDKAMNYLTNLTK